MWEFEIICSRKNSTYISFIQEGLRETVATHGGVSAIAADSASVSICVGCKTEAALHFKAKIRMLIADLICEKIKFNFILNNLKIMCLAQEYCYALAKICTCFDNDLDRQIVLQAWDPKARKINIESFFSFRLGCLRAKWLELCNITTSNSRAIQKPENFVELVQFLLSNIEMRCQSVILEMKEKCIIYHDPKKDFDTIFNIDPRDKFFVLGKLIELNPAIIKIYSSPDGLETLDLIKNIFADKVIVD